jgi:GNAT superfamily N-acetyltransferase
VTPRRAGPGEVAAVADLYLRARHGAVPAIPPLVHDDDDVRRWFAEVVLPQREVWVLDAIDHGLAALLVLDGGWLDQLYVDPARTGEGLGATLVDLAKRQRPDGLELWAFQSNGRAIAFYERHGFHEVARTDGDNEEQAPDVRLRWP